MFYGFARQKDSRSHARMCPQKRREHAGGEQWTGLFVTSIKGDGIFGAAANRDGGSDCNLALKVRFGSSAKPALPFETVLANIERGRGREND